MNTKINTKKKEDDKRSISYKETLDIVNKFAINTIEFLNNFSSTCEEKLNKVETDIQRLEIALNLLEGKLNSIESLNPSSNVQNVQNNNPTQNITTTTEVQNIQENQENNIVKVEEGTSPYEVQVMTCEQDPRLKNFFKLLKFGVQLKEIKDKMSFEGFDPSLIE
jgi:WASH complex subunit CCDC53